MTKQRKHFTTEFKQEAASLVLDHGYSMKEFCQAMGVCESAMRR